MPLRSAASGLKPRHTELQASIDVVVEAQSFENPLRDELTRRDIEQIPVRARLERVPKRGTVGETITPIGNGQLDINTATTAACFDVLDVAAKALRFSTAIDRRVGCEDARLLTETQPSNHRRRVARRQGDVADVRALVYVAAVVKRRHLGHVFAVDDKAHDRADSVCHN